MHVFRIIEVTMNGETMKIPKQQYSAEFKKLVVV